MDSILSDSMLLSETVEAHAHPQNTSLELMFHHSPSQIYAKNLNCVSILCITGCQENGACSMKFEKAEITMDVFKSCENTTTGPEPAIPVPISVLFGDGAMGLTSKHLQFSSLHFAAQAA